MKSRKDKIFVACPLKTFACQARKARWVYVSTFKVSNGRCRSCSLRLKTVKRIRRMLGNDVKIERGPNASETYVLLSCPLKIALNCKGRKPRRVEFHRCIRRAKTKGVCLPCSRYKGGHTNGDGYRIISIKLLNGQCVQRPEHRIVMEKALGRKLRKGETVHHINAKRDDNRLKNLELRMAGNHPKGWSLRQMREYLKTVPKRLGGLK